METVKSKLGVLLARRACDEINLGFRQVQQPIFDKNFLTVSVTSNFAFMLAVKPKISSALTTNEPITLYLITIEVGSCD